MLRLFVQSSPAIAVIAIALGRGQVLSDGQVVAMIFGTGLGVGGAVVLLSAKLRGAPKQIAIYQGLLSGVASLATGAAFAVEQLGGGTGLDHLLRSLPHAASLHPAYAFGAMQLAAVATAGATARVAARWLARLAPPTAEQDLARPEFLLEPALADPETALLLVEREQARLLARMPQLLDTVRTETAGAAPVPAGGLHRATAAVAGEIQDFLRAVANRHPDRETSGRLLLLERRQALLRGLNDTLHDFVQAAGQLRRTAAAAHFVDAMAEGLHAVTVTAQEATGRRDGTERELLLALTADRGDTMEKLRDRAISAAPDLPHEAKTQLIYTTSLFERAVWMLRQWTLTLPAGD